MPTYQFKLHNGEEYTLENEDDLSSEDMERVIEQLQPTSSVVGAMGTALQGYGRQWPDEVAEALSGKGFETPTGAAPGGSPFATEGMFHPPELTTDPGAVRGMTNRETQDFRSENPLTSVALEIAGAGAGNVLTPGGFLGKTAVAATEGGLGAAGGAEPGERLRAVPAGAALGAGGQAAFSTAGAVYDVTKKVLGPRIDAAKRVLEEQVLSPTAQLNKALRGVVGASGASPNAIAQNLKARQGPASIASTTPGMAGVAAQVGRAGTSQGRATLVEALDATDKKVTATLDNFMRTQFGDATTADALKHRLADTYQRRGDGLIAQAASESVPFDKVMKDQWVRARLLLKPSTVTDMRKTLAAKDPGAQFNKHGKVEQSTDFDKKGRPLTVRAWRAVSSSLNDLKGEVPFAGSAGAGKKVAGAERKKTLDEALKERSPMLREGMRLSRLGREAAELIEFGQGLVTGTNPDKMRKAWDALAQRWSGDGLSIKTDDRARQLIAAGVAKGIEFTKNKGAGSAADTLLKKNVGARVLASLDTYIGKELGDILRPLIQNARDVRATGAEVRRAALAGQTDEASRVVSGYDQVAGGQSRPGDRVSAAVQRAAGEMAPSIADKIAQVLTTLDPRMQAEVLNRLRETSPGAFTELLKRGWGAAVQAPGKLLNNPAAIAAGSGLPLGED